MTYRKTTRQTMHVTVASLDIRMEVSWSDDDAYLAHKIIGVLHHAVNGPAAEAYRHVGPWDITTTTIERTTDAGYESPVIALEFAGRNYDPMEGA